MTTYMGVDQYGETYHGLKHPRKDLCERLGRKHVHLMFVDNVDGTPRHIGYVIAGRWITLYRVEPFRNIERTQ